MTVQDQPPSVADMAAAKRRRYGRDIEHGRPNSRRLARHLRSIRIVLNIMLALALLYTVTLAKVLLIPLVLAAFLGLALNPIVASTARRRVPRWFSASVLMIGLLTAVGWAGSLLAQPAMGWFHSAPSAIRTLLPKLKSVLQPFEAASRATQSLVGGASVHASSSPATVAVSAWDLLSNTPKAMAAVLTVVLLVFFFLLYGDTLLRRLVELAPNFRHKRHTVAVVRSIQTEVSRYILTTTLINVVLGLTTAAMLWLLHVPDPLLWGAVAALANFIPYVGAITTTVVLLLVGSVHFDTLGQAMLPALCFAGITAVEGNLITPMILGRRMRVSPVAILLWLLVWGWLWGIPGALLAVPMLTSAKLIAEHVRGWEWFAHLVQR